MKPEGTEAAFVLPHAVYDKYQDLINKITNGDYNQNAMYNVVFLYTDPENARRAGTMLYQEPPESFIQNYMKNMEEIVSEDDPETQSKMFKGILAYYREGFFVNKPEGVLDPCASKNPLPSLPKKKKAWQIWK